MVISFIPQCVSILGIPFAFECIKRYDISSRGQGLKPGEGQLTWLGSRGYFLMTWNGVSFFSVMVVLLPPLTLVGIVLLIPHKCYLVLGYPKGKVFPAYRRAIQGLMSSLFFTYFPFLSTPPVIRQEKASALRLSKWQKVVSVVWFLGCEIVLPLVDMVTDFMFTGMLYELWNKDVFTHETNELLFWFVLSLFTTLVGLICGAVRFGLDTYHIGRDFSWKRVEDHIGMFSPFGGQFFSSQRNRISKLLTVIFEDLPQIAIVCLTISYVGQIDSWWATKLGMSILSASFNLAKLFTNFVFGQKITTRSRLGLQAVQFCFYLLVFGIIVKFLTANSKFCERRHTIYDDIRLIELTECISLVNETTVALESIFDQQDRLFSATTVTAPLSIGNNSVNLNFTFNQLDLLNVTIEIANNTGELILSFYPLASLIEGSGLILQSNTNLTLFSAGVLYSVDTGATLSLVDNSGICQIDLPSLGVVSGSVLFQNVATISLTLSMLSNIASKGSLFVVKNPELISLDISSLYSVDGDLDISGNNQLPGLSFPSLSVCGGQINIDSNPELKGVSIPNFVSGDLNLRISNNAVLEVITLPELIYFGGNILIEGNGQLVNFALPKMMSMGSGSSMTIRNSGSLESLSFPALDCRYAATFNLENNPKLVNVTIPKGCQKWFTSIDNNPELQFIEI